MSGEKKGQLHAMHEFGSNQTAFFFKFDHTGCLSSCQTLPFKHFSLFHHPELTDAAFKLLFYSTQVEHVFLKRRLFLALYSLTLH